MKALKNSLEAGSMSKNEIIQMLENQTEGRRKGMEALQKAGSLSDREKRKHKSVIRFLNDCKKMIQLEDIEDNGIALSLLKRRYDEEAAAYKNETQDIKMKLHYLFSFVEDTFGKGNEMLVLLTECTVNKDSAKFISMYGCDEYKRHNEEMMVSERADSIMEQIVELEL